MLMDFQGEEVLKLCGYLEGCPLLLCWESSSARSGSGCVETDSLSQHWGGGGASGTSLTGDGETVL